MNNEPYLSLEAFLKAPVAEVSKIVPKSVIFAAGGTRRATALAGIPLEDYAHWNRPRMLAAYQRFFNQGIQHLIAPLTRPQMFAEKGLYRQRLFQWLQWGLSGKESMAFYKESNWRVHMIIHGDPIPELAGVINKLSQTTATATGPDVWYIIIPDYDQLWRWQLTALTSEASTQAEAIRSLYGEDIPPAELLVSFGKPLISLDILPPLLYRELQCYWTQQPGYNLTDKDLRTILYDYAYLRPTWRQDKTGRAEEVLTYRAAWENAPTLGIGMRLGAFWYPTPITSPK